MGRDSREILKIVYIVGFPRSGTTLMGNLLGEVDGFFHMGEVERFWWRLTRHNEGRCGCHEKLSDCPFWSQVLSKTFPNIWGKNAEERIGTAWRSEISSIVKSKDHTKIMQRFFESVGEIAHARVLVDSSKSPKNIRVIKGMKKIQPYFLHMVRDVRGCVSSRQRKRMESKQAPQFHPVTTAADSLRWVWSNLGAHALLRKIHRDRSMFIRYENFADRPSATLREILELLGEGAGRLPLTDSRTAFLGNNHTVGGNRNRFGRGTVVIKPDTLWEKKFKLPDKVLVTSLTAPLLLCYGYPLRTRAPSES